mmetsp:Transcript_28255/g.67107  ORF Transcript_28255/g.67107 Transcript_28255/m.67107 type:complete len:152 (+) Transcript_28255:213-668(+)
MDDEETILFGSKLVLEPDSSEREEDGQANNTQDRSVLKFDLRSNRGWQTERKMAAAASHSSVHMHAILSKPEILECSCSLADCPLLVIFLAATDFCFAPCSWMVGEECSWPLRYLYGNPIFWCENKAAAGRDYLRALTQLSLSQKPNLILR